MPDRDPAIQKVQRQLMEIFVYIDHFCRTNNITYYLAGGTLLGAVRNEGFIPWDDDIDLMMDRENYNRFIQIAMDRFDDRFYLQCAENDPNWHYQYTKIRKNNTIYATAFSDRFKNLHQGLFIYIFVQDKTSDNRKRADRHMNKIKLWRGLVRYLWHQEAQYDYSPRKKVLLLSKFYSLSRAQKKLQQIMLTYQDKDTKMLTDSSGMHLKNGAYPQHYLGTPVWVNFEGIPAPIPEHYHEYLTYLYGKEYMTPIRYTHTIKRMEV